MLYLGIEHSTWNIPELYTVSKNSIISMGMPFEIAKFTSTFRISGSAVELKIF